MGREDTIDRVLKHVETLRSALKQSLKSLPVAGPLLISLNRKRRGLSTKPAAPAQPELVPRKFLALYTKNQGIADPEDVRDPVKKMHMDFALSTVPRGRHARNLVARHTSLAGKRYLDVGCAYGGFLVSFSEAGAGPIVGIDVNETLLGYSRALLDDYGIQATVKKGDILDPQQVRELGKFDIITCNDVIEHVLDPKLAIAHLSQLLNDGGTLYMEIPNRHATSFIEKDGHYQIFGITALPKYQADKYFAALRPGGPQYDVTYRSLPYYLNTLKRNGLLPTVLDSGAPATKAQLATMRSTLESCLSEAATAKFDDELLRKSVVVHTKRIRDTLRRKSIDDGLAVKLRRYYHTEFWTVIAQKPPRS